MKALKNVSTFFTWRFYSYSFPLRIHERFQNARQRSKWYKRWYTNFNRTLLKLFRKNNQKYGKFWIQITRCLVNLAKILSTNLHNVTWLGPQHCINFFLSEQKKKTLSFLLVLENSNQRAIVSPCIHQIKTWIVAIKSRAECVFLNIKLITFLFAYFVFAKHRFYFFCTYHNPKY